MIKRCFFLLASCCLLSVCASLESNPKTSECGMAADGGRTVKFSVGRKRNRTGHWVMTASAYKDYNASMDDVDVEVKHSTVECDGRYIMHIQGVLSETPVGHHVEKLYFHPKGGTNVVLANNGRTAYRKNEDENNGVVFTDRPLKRNTLFEVRLDKATTKFTYSLGIGITAHSPADLTIPDHMNTLRSGTWVYYDSRVFNNATVVAKGYGINLNGKDEFQIGDHVGLIIKDTGFLHFFGNGIDHGPVKANIPHSVYGFVELRGNSVQVSIV